jgi:hypothetical protein
LSDRSKKYRVTIQQLAKWICALRAASLCSPWGLVETSREPVNKRSPACSLDLMLLAQCTYATGSNRSIARSHAANVRAWGPGQHYATSAAYSLGVYTGAVAEHGAFHSGPAMASRGMRGGFVGGCHAGESSHEASKVG